MTAFSGPAWLVVGPTDEPAADADAVIVTLPSGDDRRAARAALDGWLKARPSGGPPTWVQLHAGDEIEDGVQVVLRHPVAGICLTGATTAAPVAGLDALLGSRSISVVPVVGSALGLLGCGGMAPLVHVPFLAIDEAALVEELHMDPSPDEQELASVRGHVVVVSAAFGLHPPVAGPPPPGATDDDVARSTDRLRRLGYAGRAVIDPAHVPIVRQVFGPA